MLLADKGLLFVTGSCRWFGDMGMRYCHFGLWALLIVLLLPLPSLGQENSWPVESEAGQQQLPQPGISYILRGEALARSGDPFAAIVEYRKAIAAGYHKSDVYRSLSTVLYLAGFTGEAIEALEEAVRLHPKDVYPRQELGVLYFAVGRDDAAEKAFLSVLADNPSLANTYYYLGILAFRQEKFDDAWLYARRAQLLGHKGGGLLDKLLAHGNEPMVDQREPVGEDLCFRQILVSSYEEAEALLGRLKKGEMFEVLASLASIGPSAASGGFVGCLFPDELDAALGAALWDKKAFAEPTLVETGQGAHVVQRVQPFDSELWRIQIAALKHPKPERSVSMIEKKQQGEGRYIVEAGTYNGPLLAASMVSRLRENKLPAYFYTFRDKKGALIYQVVAGRYSGKADARVASERLDRLGITNLVTTATEKAEPSATAKAQPPAKGKAVAAVQAPEEKVAIKRPVAQPVPPEQAVKAPAGKKVVAVVPPPTEARPAPRKGKSASVATGKSAKGQDALPAAALIIERKGDEPVGRYTVHAGTSDNRRKSEEIIVRMRKAGLPAFAYLSKTKKGTLVYRLVGGRFNDMHSAKAAHRRLNQLKISNFIANTQ